MTGKCLNWTVRDVALSLWQVPTQPDHYAVRIEGYGTGLFLVRMQRNGETVYQPRGFEDLGVYRDPIEAVRGAIGVALRTHTG